MISPPRQIDCKCLQTPAIVKDLNNSAVAFAELLHENIVHAEPDTCEEGQLFFLAKVAGMAAYAIGFIGAHPYRDEAFFEEFTMLFHEGFDQMQKYTTKAALNAGASNLHDAHQKAKSGDLEWGEAVKHTRRKKS